MNAAAVMTAAITNAKGRFSRHLSAPKIEARQATNANRNTQAAIQNDICCPQSPADLHTRERFRCPTDKALGIVRRMRFKVKVISDGELEYGSSSVAVRRLQRDAISSF